MDLEKWQNIQTNHLIALCEIKDDYKLFCNDLEELIKSKGNKNLINKAYKVMEGKISSKKFQNFMKKHRNTIEILKAYSCLNNLTILSYDEKGKRRKNLSEDYFLEYLQEHKEDIEIIKNVVLKIKSLGFNELSFNEKIDFTKIEYEYDNLYGIDFAFLENMEINPTYFDSPIKYKTTGSAYCIILGFNNYDFNKEISENDRNIKLNNLVFNPDRLPSEITKDSTIGVIYKLAQQKKLVYEDIKNSVNLSTYTNDILDNFEQLKKVIEKINKVKNNQELTNLLNQMQSMLYQLKLFGINFENEVIDSNKDITNEIMVREKKLYLNNRYLTNINKVI